VEHYIGDAKPRQVTAHSILYLYMRIFRLAGALLAASCLQAEPSWIDISNSYSKILLDIRAKYSPEGAASLGIPGLDEQISTPTEANRLQQKKDLTVAREKLRDGLAKEKDPLVRQDLQILVMAVERNLRASEAYEKSFLPYSDPAGMVFFGIKSLLDDQVKPERRPAAVMRLRRYTGLESGYQPLTVLAKKRFEDRLNTPGLLGPSKLEVEKDLSDTNAYVTGIGLLLEKYNMKGYQEAYTALKSQMADYSGFVKKEVLPKSRTDFRLPPAIYAINLENVGVDFSQAELTRLAHQTYTEVQGEMQTVAARIAKQRKLASSDYRDVIHELKKEQWAGDEILPRYKERLAEIEQILRREHLVTLPDRPAMIRLATAAETANQPAPHMQPPRLLNNHGEQGAFVLPMGTSGEGGKALKYDDFTFAAASWTLTAHEARPGHEMQFAAMIERGVSQARAVFAFNSVNVEGWGLYSEWFMLPYMPDEGKLISLQLRLLRAARAFLDPELQQGKVTPAQAMEILQKNVLLSEAFATEEVDRFTFRMPGQAVSYSTATYGCWKSARPPSSR
jgi:hypothetical protein